MAKIRYEYLVLGNREWNQAEEQSTSDWLTKYGREGWELTHVVPIDGGTMQWYLRRELSVLDEHGPKEDA